MCHNNASGTFGQQILPERKKRCAPRGAPCEDETIFVHDAGLNHSREESVMSDTSPRLALPFIQPAQAQKHVTHNEALERLDLVTQLTVEAFDATQPPSLPQDGQIWAWGQGSGGAWTGHDGALAAWIGGGWQFITPAPGWRAAAGSDLRLWTGSTWVAPGLGSLDNLHTTRLLSGNVF